MSCENLLQALVEELGADIPLEDWHTENSLLDEAVRDFMREQAQQYQQAKSLAEEVYLDSLGPEDLADGIAALLKSYVETNFPTDAQRVDSVTRLCQAGKDRKIDPSGAELYALLVDESETIRHESVARSIDMDKMKDVEEPVRYGDIVFLPRDAEIFVIGDTHGDLASVERTIGEIEESQAIAEGAFIVFLGDYVHNGVKNRRSLHRILTFQRAYPSSVILLSGNHEFRETYGTAAAEYFRVHWDHYTETEIRSLPDERLHDRLPGNDNHYGHFRLELASALGFAEGERIYRAYEEWGIRLPNICISGDLMISHSIGRVEGKGLRLSDIVNAKAQDAADIRRLGTAAWKARRGSAHSAMVNTREIDGETVAEFQRLFGVSQFVVGHCHYRSGDTVAKNGATVTTVVSSDPYSPDAGHYMYHEMIDNRKRQRAAEALPDGDALACYLYFRPEHDGTRTMKKMPIKVDHEGMIRDSQPAGREPREELNLNAQLAPAPRCAKFSDEEYYIWGASMARTPDGRCHLLYSRWPRRLGHNAWVTHSEIAHAAADHPLGPYRHVDVALPRRGAQYWDGLCTHNPTVHAFDGKYYLYYMGNTGDDRPTDELNWIHRNNQRIGAAVADHPGGPWQRFDRPLIDVSQEADAPDALVTSNPSICRRPDGVYVLVYKAVGRAEALPFGGPVVHLAATAKSPTGPFTKHAGPLFTVPGESFPAEDPYIWTQDGRLWAIVKDQRGHFTGAGKSLALFTSEDGLQWRLASHPLVSRTQVEWQETGIQQLNSLERPQLWLDNGAPALLFCAADVDSERSFSFNVHIPLGSR